MKIRNVRNDQIGEKYNTTKKADPYIFEVFA